MSRPMNVPHHYYRGYPVDFTGGRAAARTFKGWTSEAMDLDLDRSALLLMHLPDSGLRPEVRFAPDCPRPDLLGTAEWVPRTMDMVTKSLPPLVEAARAARLQVVHIAMNNWYAKDFPQRQRSIAEAGPAPAASTELTPLEDVSYDTWSAERDRRIFPPMVAKPDAPKDVEHVYFPRDAQPSGDDLVAVHTWELHRLMKARGIVNLIYTGWALNWCLWFSPCGMLDMERLRYRPYAVRGACVAIENAESAVGEKNLDYAYWQTAAKFGYLFERDELTESLGRMGR